MSWFNIHTFIYIYIWPTERKPAHPANIEFQFYPYRLFSSYTEIMAPGSLYYTVPCYEPRLCYYKGAISLDSQAGQGKRVAKESLVHVFQKGQFHKLAVCIWLFFCLHAHCKPPLSQPLSFPTVLLTFKLFSTRTCQFYATQEYTKNQAMTESQYIDV